MGRIGHEVVTRLKKNQYTARISFMSDTKLRYKGDFEELCKRELTWKLAEGIEGKLIVKEIPKDRENPNPRGDIDEYEAKLVILSLEDAQDILNIISHLEGEVRFNGNRDGWESISSELFRKLTQPTAENTDSN